MFTCILKFLNETYNYSFQPYELSIKPYLRHSKNILKIVTKDFVDIRFIILQILMGSSNHYETWDVN